MNCTNIKNGHNFNSLIKSLSRIKKNNKPHVFLANTIKGKGIKEFEKDPIWHARKITDKDLKIAKKRLNIL